MSTDIVWQPSEKRIAEAEITRFAAFLSAQTGHTVADSKGVAELALDGLEAFWSAPQDHFGVIGDKGVAPFVTGDDMPSTRFFPAARLNFAENLLGMGEERDAGAPALVLRSDADGIGFEGMHVLPAGSRTGVGPDLRVVRNPMLHGMRR